MAAGLAFGGISAAAAYQTNAYPKNVWVMLSKFKMQDTIFLVDLCFTYDCVWLRSNMIKNTNKI